MHLILIKTPSDLLWWGALLLLHTCKCGRKAYRLFRKFLVLLLMYMYTCLILWVFIPLTIHELLTVLFLKLNSAFGLKNERLCPKAYHKLLPFFCPSFWSPQTLTQCSKSATTKKTKLVAKLRGLNRISDSEIIQHRKS